MEKYLVNSYESFFSARKKLGYVSSNKMSALLIMTFIYRLVFYDYRGLINKEDYHYIEKAINCLYGKNCLLPYRDYLKMGRLKIGEYTELAQKLRNIKIDSTGTVIPDLPDDLLENLETIQNVEVAKYKGEYVETVSDIKLPNNTSDDVQP